MIYYRNNEIFNVDDISTSLSNYEYTYNSDTLLNNLRLSVETYNTRTSSSTEILIYAAVVEKIN